MHWFYPVLVLEPTAQSSPPPSFRELYGAFGLTLSAVAAQFNCHLVQRMVNNLIDARYVASNKCTEEASLAKDMRQGQL